MGISRRIALSTGLAAGAHALLVSRRSGATVDCHPSSSFCLPDGRKLHYAEYGTPAGVPVVYFHGTPGSHLEVGLVDEELDVSGVRLISVSRPGMGRSTFQSCRRITCWPDDVAHLINATVGPDAPFGIIALSGGAPYGLAVARAMPHRVTHLALVSGHTPPYAPCVQPGNSDKMIELIRRRPRLGRAGLTVIDRRLNRKPDQTAQMVMKSWSDADRRLVQCNCKLYRRLIANLKMATRCGPCGVQRDIALLGSCWGFRVCEAAGIPITIWQGGCDRIVTPSMARYFHRQLPGSELFEDPRAGHVTMFKWHVDEILARF